MIIQNIPLKRINEPDDPARLQIDLAPLQELVDSISDRGLLQPILLKRTGERFEVEAGHRRFLALKQLQWETAPSIILGDNTPGDLHIDRAHENLIRQDLSVIDEARMVNAMVNENDQGIEKTSRIIKRSQSWVESRLDILNYQSDLVDALAANNITLSVAKALSKCNNEEYRLKLLSYVIDTGATAKTVSTWVNDSSIEDFTNALDNAKETGIIQSIDLGAVHINCGICMERFKSEQLRHLFLCSTCMQGVVQIRDQIFKEAPKQHETQDEAPQDDEH